MKTKRKQINAELYSIFCDVYSDEKSRETAIKESRIAYTIIKQDALFRTMSTMYHELQ